MTVDWEKADGSSGVVIAASGDYVSEFRVNGQAALQPMPSLRASTVRHKGRGNLGHRVSFLVTHTPATSAAAALEDLAEKTSALEGTVLTHELLTGAFGSITWQLVDAALENYELWQVGATMYARYSFLGGEFSKVVAP